MSNTPPQDWTAITGTDIIDEYPDDADITADGGPFIWENQNTERTIWIEPNNELDDFEQWLVTGENSVVTSAATVAEAQEAATRFMENNTHPSAMI